MSGISDTNKQSLPYSLSDGLLLRVIKTFYQICASLIAPLTPAPAINRFVLALIRFIYPCQTLGISRIPAQKGALIAANHISLLDGLLIMAALERKVHFLVSEKTACNWFVKPWLKHFNCIPLITSAGIKGAVKSLKRAAAKIEQGELVCVFPEGHVSRIATVLPFRRGLKVMLANTDASIIPAYLDNLWGSIFSFCGGRFVTRIPPSFRRQTGLVFGHPLPASTTNAALRLAVVNLGAEAWELRRRFEQPVHRLFLRTMRRKPFHQAFGDIGQPMVSRMSFLIKTVAVTRAVKKIWAGQKNVGIMIPTTPVAAMLNIAASISGKTSVNLNFTSGKNAVKSAIRQAGLQTVITAKPIEARFPNLLPETVKKYYIEDLAAQISLIDKIIAAATAIFAPTRLFEKICGQEKQITLDDPITIIFSSGSTGDPKGVVLSHFNLIANVRQTDQYLKLGDDDMVLEILPFFHSFGYLGMWMALAMGLPAIFHPNPLDAQAIGEICEKCRVTFFFATPTFAQMYLRKCRPEQFGSIKNLITGAEKLSLKIVESYRQNFGIIPTEGYGTTECSPVLSINVNNYRDSGLLQVGSLTGSVGQPVPGVAVKIVDPETMLPLGFDQPGLLLVKGPNLMQGYLHLPEATAQVMQDGWYNTGDIALITKEGFIKITDRLARFSKIGGEMVPHGVIEDLLQNLSQEESRVFAVTGVPDEKKGEVLVVLYTIDPQRIPEILKQAGESGLPNLFLPKHEHFIKVDEMPVLGSGKIDLRRLKQIAQDLFGPQRKFR